MLLSDRPMLIVDFDVSIVSSCAGSLTLKMLSIVCEVDHSYQYLLFYALEF